MASNPYMALVDAESSNPYMDIVKGEGEDYKSATGILKGAGQIAGSLITPLVAWPLAKYIGAVRGAHAWGSGDKEPGKVFDEAYEDAMQRMTGIYQPPPESPAERTIRPVVKGFEALAGGGSEAGELVSESWKLPPEGVLSRIAQTGGEFGAFTAGGKAAGGLKRGAKTGAAGLRKAVSAKRLETSLEYHPSVEPPPAPPTGEGFGIPIIRPPTSGKVITAPTSEKEVARLEAKLKPPEGFELVRDSDKAVPSEPILPEGFELLDEAKIKGQQALEEGLITPREYKEYYDPQYELPPEIDISLPENVKTLKAQKLPEFAEGNRYVISYRYADDIVSQAKTLEYIGKNKTGLDMFKTPEGSRVFLNRDEIISSKDAENVLTRAGIKPPTGKVVSFKRGGPENLITYIKSRGGINLGEDYSDTFVGKFRKPGKNRELEFPDVRRVANSKTGKPIDEMVVDLNAEGFAIKDADELMEILRSGQARTIFTPDASDYKIEQLLRRQENEWIERELAKLEDAENARAEISTDKEYLKRGLLDEIEAQGAFEDASQEIILKELDDYFAGLSETPPTIKEGIPGLEKHADSLYAQGMEFGSPKAPRIYEPEPPPQFKTVSEESLGVEPKSANPAPGHKVIMDSVQDKPWEWTVGDLMDLRPSELQKKLDKIWGPEEDFTRWIEEGEGADKRRYWSVLDHAADLEVAIKEGDSPAVESILADVQRRLQPQDYYAYEETSEQIRKISGRPGVAGAPESGQGTRPIPETTRTGTSAAPAREVSQPSIPGLTFEETFALTSKKAKPYKKPAEIAPQTGKLFERGAEPPEFKESKLAKRAEAAAIEIKLTDDFGDLVEYRTMNMKEQAEAAQQIMDWNYESAKRMAMGEELPPKGVREATMYEAVKIRALKEGDVDTLRKLATESTVPRKLSEYGQAIKAADSRLMIDPVTDMRDVMKTRTELAKRTGSKVDPGKQAAEIERLNKELEVAKKALDEHVARKEAGERAAAIDELIKQGEKPEPKERRTPSTYGSKNKIVTLSEYEKTKLELRKQFATQLNVGIDPTVMVKLSKLGTFHIEAGSRVIGEWSAKMIEDVGDWVKPHLADIWESSKSVFNTDTVKSHVEKISTSLAKDEGLPEIGVYVQKLAKHFVSMGIKDRNSLVKAVHDVLKEIIPGITRRETMDAISGYGDYKLLTKDEVSVQLRDIKGQLQQVAKLEDLESKKPPLKTGIERRTPSDEERKLIKLVEAAKRKYGIQTIDKETQLKSALDAVKTRLTNQITDLESQIASRQKIVKDKTSIVYDAEANKLKTRRDELKRDFDTIFGKSEMTDVQRVTIAINAVKKSINEYARRIAEKDLVPQKAISKTPETSELKALRTEREVLAKQYRDMQKIARPKTDPQIIAVQRALFAADKSITEYLRRIAQKELAPKKKIDLAAANEDVKLMRKARDTLKAELQEMRDLLNPKKTPDEIATQRLKTRLKNEEKKFRDKLENLDFSKKEKRTTLLDPEARILKDKHERAKENYNAAAQMSRAITKEEATNLVSLSQTAADAKTVMEQGGDRFAYGAARVAYENYVNDLHGANLPIKAMLKNRLHEAETAWSENKVKAVGDVVQDTLKVIADNSVSMVATLDNSFLGRQGIHTLMTHPSVWWPAAKKSFSDFASTIGGKNAHDALMADIYSRPNFLNGEYQKAGIITGLEEQFPTTLPERIPGIGRVFRASEYAFTGSGLRMRTGLYDLLSEIAKSNGVNMLDKVQAESVGKLINSLTARGKWGKRGEPDIVRLVLWAPKMLKGNWDVLTAHTGGYGLESAFARKQAGMNLLKIIAETAVIMTVANAIKPGSAETNPASPAFGKIKIGDTYFDYSGGMFSIITLAERLRTGKTKDPVTGRIKPIPQFNALINFLAGKTNPPASIVRDWLKGYHYGGEPFTWPMATYRAATPITIQQAIELKDNASADRVAGVIADAVGVSASQYDRKKIPGRAQGGPIKKGIPYVVGEKGPEIIIPRQDGFVIPGSAIKSRSSFLPIPAARVEKFRGNSIPMPQLLGK